MDKAGGRRNFPPRPHVQGSPRRHPAHLEPGGQAVAAFDWSAIDAPLADYASKARAAVPAAVGERLLVEREGLIAAVCTMLCTKLEVLLFG